MEYPMQTSLSRFSERMRVLTLILLFFIPFQIRSSITVKIPENAYLQSHYPLINDLPSFSFYLPLKGVNDNFNYLLKEPKIYKLLRDNPLQRTKYPISYEQKVVYTGLTKYRGFSISSFLVQPSVKKGDSLVSYKKLLIDINHSPVTFPSSPGYLSSIFPRIFRRGIEEDTSYLWQKPDNIPILGDAKVDYIIITDSSFLPYFKQYQDFWWLMGLRTRTVSIQAIKSYYDGISLQNKIRKFLKDAVSFWDTRYVLLAGDNNTIPIIYFHTDFYGQWLDSPTDMYYSCLDGNWNADFDYYLGEAPSDSIDLLPDVALGRLSINTYEDITEYFEKLKTYMLNPDTTILKKALFVGADLFSSGDGKMWCDTISEYHFPQDYYKVVLSEFDGTSAPGNSNQAVIDSLNEGFYFYYHNSHGSHNQIQLKHTTPRVYITNEDCDNFTNTYPNIVFVVSCYTNEFPFDVIGEHWVLQHNGAIAYIASINDEFPYPAMYFEKPFFDSLFNSAYSRIGDILNIGKLPIMSYAETNGVYRDIYLFESLQGDPAVPVWKGIPGRITILDIPDSIIQGDTFAIQILSNTNDKIDCNMITPDGKYLHKTVLANHISHFHPVINVSGNLIISFFHKGYVPVIDTIYVKASSKTVKITNIRIDDSLNKYPDGIAENGDTIILQADMIHYDSTPYSVYLSSTNDISILNGVFHDSTAFPGDTVTMHFKIHIPFTTKNRSVPLIINIPGIYLDTINLQIKSPDIVQKSHRIIQTGEREYSISMDLLNKGLGSGFDYSFTLSATDKSRIIFSVSDTLPHIFQSDSIFTIDSIDFSLPDGSLISINDVEFSLKIYNIYDSSTTVFYYDTVQIPHFVTSIPHKNSIKLLWDNTPEAVGYDLYIRKDGDFTKINRDLIEDGTFYTVSNLKQDSAYTFKIRAYDRYMNPSNYSNIYYEKTTPFLYANWPINYSDISLTSIIPADFFGDGNIEIFEAFKSGKLLMTYLNGDTVPGWPVYIEDEIWGTPAIADVNNDGKLDIVVAPWSSQDKVYLFNPNGTLLSGWPRFVQGDSTNKGLYGVAGSPVIRDINGDGIDEILIGATNGDIFIWEPDGSGFYRSDGLFAKRNGDDWDLNVVSPQDLDGDSTYIIYALSRLGVFYAFSTIQYNSDSLAIFLSGTPDTLSGGTYYQPTSGNVGPAEGKEVVLTAGSALYLYNDSLELYPNFPVPLKSNVFISQPILHDINGDGYKDILLAVGDSIYCYNYQGNLLNNYPYKFGTAMQSSPVAGTMNDTPFIFIGTGELNISAFSIYGQKMAGFPITTEDNFYCSPTIGNSILGANDYSSNIYLWKIPVQSFPWPSIYHDFQHTGDADFPLSNQIAVRCNKIMRKEKNNINISMVKGILHIKGLSKNDKYKIKIFDIAGRKVEFRHIANDKLQILSQNNGVYFIKIDSDSIKYINKFLFLK